METMYESPETDPDVRHSLYCHIEEQIREHAILLPLLHDQFHCFTRPEVEGLELNYFYPLIAFDNLSARKRCNDPSILYTGIKHTRVILTVV